MANAKSVTTGKHMVVTGLVLQIIFFGIFVITSGIFHYRIVRKPTQISLQVSWKKYIFTLYFASILILIRSVFRVVEFSAGNDSVIMRNEVFLIIFDSILMLGVVVALNLVHPGTIMGSKGRAREGVIPLEDRDVTGADIFNVQRK